MAKIDLFTYFALSAPLLRSKALFFSNSNVFRYLIPSIRIVALSRHRKQKKSMPEKWTQFSNFLFLVSSWASNRSVHPGFVGLQAKFTKPICSCCELHRKGLLDFIMALRLPLMGSELFDWFLTVFQRMFPDKNTGAWTNWHLLSRHFLSHS